MDETAPPRPRKTLDERLASVAARQQQLEARRLALLAVKKSADRKRDARRKIIVGAAVLARAERDPAFADMLRAILDETVTKASDRAVIADLLPGAEGDGPDAAA